MKIKSTVVASLLLTSCAFADSYIFTGELSGELTDYNNYLKVTNAPSIWASPFKADGAEVATSLPTDTDTICIGDYKYPVGVDDEGNTTYGSTYYGPDVMTISDDFAVKGVQFRYRGNNSYYPTINIGSAENDVTFSVTGKGTTKINTSIGFLAGSYSNRTMVLQRAEEAVDTNVVVSIATLALCQDKYKIGTVETGAIDVISLGYLALWWTKVDLSTYADKIEVLDGVEMNFETSTVANSWTIIVSDKAFDNGAYVDVMGYFTKLDNQKIAFDFSQTELEEGMVYDLMAIDGTMTGFNKEDVSSDFDFIGLDDVDYSVAWNGNTLQLTTAVPEASEVAAVLGIAALAFAYIRRRK